MRTTNKLMGLLNILFNVSYTIANRVLNAKVLLLTILNVLLVALLLQTSVAKAETKVLEVCHKATTSEKIWFSIGSWNVSKSIWESVGWWGVASGECVTPSLSGLAGASGRYFYVYGYSETTKAEWPADQTQNGSIIYCIAPGQVAYIPHPASYGSTKSQFSVCTDAGYQWKNFYSIDTGTTVLSKWTHNFTGGSVATKSLSSLTATCPSTITSSGSGSCTATAYYSDGTSKAVSPTWSSSNTSALYVYSSGSLYPYSVTSDTYVTVSASYSEGGITKTASQYVTVKAAVTSPTLSSLTTTCPSTVAATSSSGASCTATAYYSDGNSKVVSPTWSSSNTSALYIYSSGSLYAYNVISDTYVTVSASYSEGGITKTSSQSIAVKTALAKLTGLTISGDTDVQSGKSLSLSAKGSYSDGTSQSVSATWASSDSSTASVSNFGVVTAKMVTFDTPVTITASYTENGVTQTATWMISVKATTAVLTDLTVSGSDTLEAGKSATYIAKTSYNDGSSKTASNVTWSASGIGATIDAQGVLTADTKLSADTTVTVLAVYTENGVSKTAQMKVTVKTGSTSACNGTDSNLSAITIAGKTLKSPGDSLQVDYCLKNYNSATKFDVYVAVALPDGTMLFMQSAGFFGSPTFTPYDGKTAPKAYLTNTLIPDKSGPVLQIPTMPMDLPTGTYTFYAIPVFAGKDVFNGFNWVGHMASAKLNFMR